VDERAISGSGIDDPPRPVLEDCLGVMAAGERRLRVGEDERIVAAAADAHARPGEDELFTAPRAGCESQPQQPHALLLLLADRVFGGCGPGDLNDGELVLDLDDRAAAG